MNQLIEARDGYINLAFVRKIVQRSRTENGHKRWAWIAIDSEGEEHELYGAFETATFIPAVEPLKLLRVWGWDDDENNNQLTADYEFLPVIAWRLNMEGDFPLPVCPGSECEEPANNVFRFYEITAGGQLVYLSVDGDHRFETIDDCKNHCLTQIRLRREDEAKKLAAEPA